MYVAVCVYICIWVFVGGVSILGLGLGAGVYFGVNVIGPWGLLMYPNFLFK